MFRRGADDCKFRKRGGVSSVGWKLRTGRIGNPMRSAKMEWGVGRGGRLEMVSKQSKIACS